MPRLTTWEKNVACGIKSFNRWGIFSCPSGIKVSSSRAPPPKVTTTARFARGAAMPRRVEGPKKAVAAPAPVADRRKFRRLSEIARATSPGLPVRRSRGTTIPPNISHVHPIPGEARRRRRLHVDARGEEGGGEHHGRSHGQNTALSREKAGSSSLQIGALFHPFRDAPPPPAGSAGALESAEEPLLYNEVA